MTTEPTATSLKPSLLRRYALPLLVGVAAVAILGYVASRSGLDKALLRQQLDDFGARVHSAGLAHGRDVTFTYGEVAIEGSFSHKHAVVHDPKFTLKPAQGGGDGDVLAISTPTVEIYAKAADLSALEIRAPQPIDFTDPMAADKKLLTIAADAPLSLSLAQGEEEGVPYLDMQYPTPQKLTFTYLREHQAQGVEDATPTVVPVYHNIQFTMAPGGVLHSHLSTDGHDLGKVTVNLRDLHVIPEGVPNGEVVIAEITADSSNLLNDKKQAVASLKLHVGDVTASPDFIPYAPLSLTVNGTYEGNAAQTPEDVAAIGKQQSALKLTEFAFTSKEAKLTATADFATSAGDALPEGTANITLTNVPYVLKELTDNGILNDTNLGFVIPVLEMTTGQKLTDIKDAVIDIQRQKGAAFTIGKTTFEELFAVVLKNALTQAHPPAASVQGKQVPDAAIDAAPAAKKTAPDQGALQVEEGARG